jgi:flagellar hook-length control protein FliK
MELSALPGSGPTSGRLEGRTEGVRDGKVTVRLATGAVMEVPTSEAWTPGTPVALAAGSDGKIQIIPLAVNPALLQARQSLWEALSEILGNPQTAKDVSQALAKNDFAKAASLLAADSSGKPSALLSQNAGVLPPTTASVVELLAQIQPGKFQAQVAGSSWELWSSPEVTTPQRLSAKASVLPDGSAVWTPVRTSAIARAIAPESVTADIDGARVLLELSGAPSAPPAVVEDLALYLRQSAMHLLDRQPPQALGDSRPAQTKDKVAGASVDPSVPVAKQFPPSESTSRTSTPAQVASESAPLADKPHAVSRLDAQTAQRALVAWSLDIASDHPELSALLGKGKSLVQTLESLRTWLAASGERHAALSASVDRVLGSGKLLPDAREELEQRILQAISTPEGAEDPESPLAQTARSLLGERLGESGRDGAWRGETMWTKNDSGWQPERVVVHDRRKRGAHQRPDHHVAEIRLEPKGAGAIDAKLTLDGRILSIRMEAESAETARLLREHLGELRSAIDKLGLSVSGLEVARSDQARGETSRRTGSGGGFDVRA